MKIGNKDISNYGVLGDCQIGAPELVERTITIPGRNGYIDATEALTGYPVYGTREIVFTIGILEKSGQALHTILDSIYKDIHGKKLDFITDESTYHYEGRWVVDGIEKVDQNITIVTIHGECQPYHLKNNVTTVSGSGTINLTNAGMPTKLTIVNDSQVTITRNGVQTTYSAGTHIINYPLLTADESITSSGQVSISYQEGKL